LNSGFYHPSIDEIALVGYFSALNVGDKVTIVLLFSAM
jgi:hypothetical protein